MIARRQTRPGEAGLPEPRLEIARKVGLASGRVEPCRSCGASVVRNGRGRVPLACVLCRWMGVKPP